MVALTRYVPPSPSQLLSHILDRHELVAAIRELPAPTLFRLIERIGIEDSAELIALASTEQITGLLDEDLWRADEAGFDTHFDPKRFALWLQVMGEAGDEFIVRRLCELPVDLLTLAINRLVLVIDMDSLRSFYAGARDELGQIERALENALVEEWEEFCLIARDLDAWEDVWNALLLLDREHHAHLRAILEQCCAMSLEYIDGQGGLYDVLTSDEMLESDALASRDDRRAAQGYVSLSDARAFLELARDERQPLAQRDPISAGHFRVLDTKSTHDRAASVARQLATTSHTGSALEELLRLVAELDAEPEPRRLGAQIGKAASADGARLPALDQQGARRKPGKAERLQDGNTGAERGGKSSGRSAARGWEQPPAAATKSQPASRTRAAFTLTRERPAHLAEEARNEQPELPLLLALAALSSAQPGLHAARMDELAYLANVIIAGCKHEGRQLRPVEALEAALATTNLGLALWTRSEPDCTAEGDVRLVRAVTCDRLFRLAWSRLQRELVQTARDTLAKRCAKLDAVRARQAQKWIKEQSPHGLRRLCAADELELSEQSFELLLTSAESLPWQTAAHSHGRPLAARRWIAVRDELERARQRLAELAASS